MHKDTGTICTSVLNSSGAIQRRVPVSGAMDANWLARDCTSLIFLLKPKSHHLYAEAAST